MYNNNYDNGNKISYSQNLILFNSENNISDCVKETKQSKILEESTNKQ